MMNRLLLVIFLFASLAKANAGQPPITAVLFSPGAQTVVACSQSGVTVYSWPDLEPVKQIATSAPNLHDLAFSPSGDRLAIAGGTPADDGTVEIISWPEGESLHRLNGHFDSVMSVCWLDESTLASASLDHDVIIWNVANGEKLRTLKGHSRGVTSVEYLKEQQILVSAGLDQSLRVWAPSSGELIRSLAIHVKPVSSVRLRPLAAGLPMVASASDDKTVRFWQPTIGRMVRFARLPTPPREIQWSPDGAHVVACCDDGHVYVINPDTVEVVREFATLNHWASTLAVHPIDSSVLVGGSDGKMERIPSSALSQ